MPSWDVPSRLLARGAGIFLKMDIRKPLVKESLPPIGALRQFFD